MTFEVAAENKRKDPVKRRRTVRREPWDETTRQKIKSGLIINYLHQHIENTREMSATQIRAAEILLKKTLPDLATVDHKNTGGNLNITFNWGVEKTDAAQIIDGKAKQIGGDSG